MLQINGAFVLFIVVLESQKYLFESSRVLYNKSIVMHFNIFIIFYLYYFSSIWSLYFADFGCFIKDEILKF